MGTKAPQPEERRAWDWTVRRSVDVECRAIDESARSVDVIASTEALDAHGDIIRQFWDLRRYQKNPVVLWAHNIFESSPSSFGGAVRPADLFPIGRAENTTVDNGKLKSTLVLGSAEYSDIADKVFRGFQEKMLRAVSVGFRPGSVKRVQKPNGREFFELGDEDNPNELREISVVPMGSNPDAVAKALAFERDQLRSYSFGVPILGRKKTAERRDNHKGIKTMDEELEQARVDLGVAKKQLEDERATIKALDDKLEAEKKLSARLQGDLDAANKRLAEADMARTKAELDALQGVKFAPSEREELDGMAKDLGLERVVGYLKKRADLAVTKQTKIVDRDDPPQPPVEDGDTSSKSLVDEVDRRVKGAA